MNFVVSICFNVLVMIINYIILYLYIMFYLYFVVSSLTYINPIKPSLDNSCSPSMFHLRSFLLLGPHGRPMRLGARHVSFDFHPREKRAKQLPPMGKSITMADSNDPIPYIPSNENMNQTEPNSLTSRCFLVHFSSLSI